MKHDRRVRLVEFTRSFYYGGTEIQLVELLRGLSSRYDVHVGALEAGGPLVETVASLGYLPEEFPMPLSAARPNTALQIGRLAWWLRSIRAEVLHVHDFYATLIAVPAAKLAGCKVIVGRLDLAHWHGKYRRAVLAQLTRMADHVVANAHAIEQMLVEEEGIPKERISVIHNGLDIGQFDARRAKGLSSPLPAVAAEAPVVVHVANMNHPVKRQEDLLESLAIARKKVPNLTAFLVGDGPRRAQLEAKSKALGLEGAAHFLGYRNDIPAIYEKATFGVLCSNAEGLSNAVMEGMAASLPMVVTSVGGNPELVADGERGFVVPKERPVELANAFLRVVEDSDRARAMGQRARTFVEQHLSLSAMVDAHDALYRRVVGQGPAQQRDEEDSAIGATKATLPREQRIS